MSRAAWLSRLSDVNSPLTRCHLAAASDPTRRRRKTLAAGPLLAGIVRFALWTCGIALPIHHVNVDGPSAS